MSLPALCGYTVASELLLAFKSHNLRTGNLKDGELLLRRQFCCGEAANQALCSRPRCEPAKRNTAVQRNEVGQLQVECQEGLFGQCLKPNLVQRGKRVCNDG